jgi:hypothetical protein
MKRAFAIALASIAVSLTAGGAAVLGLRPPSQDIAAKPAAEPRWSETPWPFPIDQWGTGKAFVCAPADCGVRVAVYLRPKVGFCNCSTGVSDDAELERVSDTALVTQEPHARAPGQPIKVAWMRGLSRPYRAIAGGMKIGLLSIAFNDDCDAVVALATTGKADPEIVAPAVLALLNSTPVVLWTKRELGLEFVRRDW